MVVLFDDTDVAWLEHARLVVMAVEGTFRKPDLVTRCRPPGAGGWWCGGGGGGSTASTRSVYKNYPSCLCCNQLSHLKGKERKEEREREREKLDRRHCHTPNKKTHSKTYTRIFCVFACVAVRRFAERNYALQ